MPKTLIIFLLPILLVFNVFGQKQPSKTPKSKTQTKRAQTQIPKGWKLVDLNRFSVLLPESMEDKKVRGTDSAIWCFEDNEMTLIIDSGMYKLDFSDKENFENLTKPIEVNGIKGQYFYINYLKPKTSQTEIFEVFKQNPFQEAIDFKHDNYSYTSFWILYKKTEQQETAKIILQSIKFKK